MSKRPGGRLPASCPSTTLYPPEADHCPEQARGGAAAPASAAAPALALSPQHHLRRAAAAAAATTAAAGPPPPAAAPRSSSCAAQRSNLPRPSPQSRRLARLHRRFRQTLHPIFTPRPGLAREGSFIRRVRASTCRTAAAVAVVKPSAPAPLRRSRALQTDKAGGFGRRTHSPRGASRRNQISDDCQQGDQKQRASTLRARPPSLGPGGGGLPHPPWNPGRASPSSFLFREEASRPPPGDRCGPPWEIGVSRGLTQ